MKFNLTDKEIDIISEALTLYSDIVAGGKRMYTSDEVDAVSEIFEI